MTEQSDALTTSVIEWLNSSGATVELSTARTLSTNGLHVIQGFHLRDPETPETAREIDVIGSRELQLVDVGTIGAYLVIECKYALKPWVIVRGRPEYESAQQNFDRITTLYGREWLEAARFHPAINDTEAFRQEPRPGHALVTAHVVDESRESGTQLKANRNNQDVAYSAIMAATKAAQAWADALSERPGPTNFGVVFPVVVLRGNLYEAWLDGDRITARSISSGQVFWTHPSVNHPVIVDIVTDAGLDQFARIFYQTAEALVHHGREAAQGINTTGVY